MSTSADSAEGASELVELELRTDLPGAELLLVNGEMKLRARGFGSLIEQVEPGIYTARVRMGEASHEQLVVVRPGQSRTVIVDSPQVESAIPIGNSLSSREYHQDAVREALRLSRTAAHDGADVDLLFFAREWTSERKGRRGSGRLLNDVRLCDENGSELYRIDTEGVEAQGDDRFWSSSRRVRAGFYRLRIAEGDVTIELPLYAVPGWEKHVYLLAKPSRSGLAVDLPSVAMIWRRPGTPFEPNSPDLKQLEWARLALQSQRRVRSTKDLTAVLFEKFENPMLALLGAHALVQRKAIAPELLVKVIGNLRRLLGPLPDVQALELALDSSSVIEPVRTPPLLKRSWVMLLEGSMQRPGIVARNSLAEQLGLHAVDDGIWMCWRDAVDAAEGTRTQPTLAQSLMRAARAAWSEERVRQSTATTTRPQQALQRVVSWFGVPRAMLDDIAAERQEEPLIGAQQLANGTRGRSSMTSDSEQRSRDNNNEEVVRRMFARRPQLREKYAALLDTPTGARLPPGVLGLLPEGAVGEDAARALVFETIVREQRPVLFTQAGQLNTTEATIIGEEAQDLVSQLTAASGKVLPRLPLVGRIDVTNFPGAEFVGTGWFVERDVVVTNRHVAQLFARQDGRKFVFNRGVGGAVIGSSLCSAHEFDDPVPAADQVFKVLEVLYIESETGPNDIAFLRVERPVLGNSAPFIELADADVASDVPICVVGYPARASRRAIPDQVEMKNLYRDRFDVKRIAPGYTMSLEQGSCRHDCTTLGGNSGSVLLELASGRAVGLHFAGLYRQANYAIPASVLKDYVQRRRWNTPPELGGEAPPPLAQPVVAPPVAAAAASAAGTSALGTMTFTIPVSVTVSIGAALAGGLPISGVTVAAASGAPGPASAPTLPQAKEAVRAYWRERPAGVLGVRIGFLEEAGEIGDTPCIAVSVAPSQLSALQASAPTEFARVPVRYFAADVSEQLASLPLVEAVDSIAYDDDARAGADFSFAIVEEEMTLKLHVGPEYSWDVLKGFLGSAQRELVSSMYEFHAPHIKDALEERQQNQVISQMMLDNATFSGAKPPEGFDRPQVFEQWANAFGFQRLIAPEGRQGLISDAYHMKVTVRDGNSFWLSSGNWKAGSSQPIITQEERDNVEDQDLKGNREWHIVVENETLAQRFRNHIVQDFERSRELGAQVLPKRLLNETMVDVPLESVDLMLEARLPPARVLEPLDVQGKIKVKPLLTPDKQGAVYSKTVIRLIRGAQESLLFQIPYIGLPSDPNTSRGFIDDLIGELTSKMAELDDARIILRGGLFAGKRYSSPTHLAWHLKANGVDVSRLRTLEDTHTKGMVVDGKRVLIGSHNWSGSGVSLNRDASLLFDNDKVAAYYAEAFEIDWARAVRVKPKKFVVREAIEGAALPAGYVRMPLSAVLKDE